MKNTLRKLQINKVALVDAGAGKGVPVQLFKRRSAEGSNMKVEKMELPELLAMVSALPEDQKAQILAALGKAAEPTDEEKAKKAADEEAEKAVSKARAEKDVEISELRKSIAEMKKSQERIALTTRVEKQMRGLPGELKDIVAELESIADPSVRETVAKRYESMSAERIEISKKHPAFHVVGTSLDGGGTSPVSEFAVEVSKVADSLKITKAQAHEEVAKRRPDLYTAAKAAEGKVA